MNAEVNIAFRSELSTHRFPAGGLFQPPVTFNILSGENLWLPDPCNDLFCNDDGFHALDSRDVIHQIQHDILKDCSERPRTDLHLRCSPGHRLDRPLSKLKRHSLDLE